MNKEVIVFVRHGMVQRIVSNSRDVNVTILDFDMDSVHPDDDVCNIDGRQAYIEPIDVTVDPNYVQSVINTIEMEA